MFRGSPATLTRSDDAGGVLVVGGLLTLLTWVVTPAWIGAVPFFPPLVVLAPLALAPAFVARGYYVRLLADAAETGNADGAPPFVAWNDLYRNGFKSALLSGILLLPLVLLFALVALAGGIVGSGRIDPTPVVGSIESTLGDDGVMAVVGLGSALLAVVTLTYLVVFAYVRPAALAAFAATGRLRDGLRPGRVATVAVSSEYATAWIVAMAALGAGYAISAPFVSVLVGVVFVFVVRVIVHALYGRGAVTALEEVGADSATGASRAVSMATAFSRPTTTVSARTESAAGDEPVDEMPRQSRPEAPPAVQTGETARPGGGFAVGADGGGIETSDIGHGGGDEAGFEWRSGVDGRLETDGSDGTGESNEPKEPDEAGEPKEPGADDVGFEWGTGSGDGEDKS